MPTLHFLGYILPQPVNISIGHDPTVNWTDGDTGTTYAIKAAVKDSKIDVEVTVSKYDPETDFVANYMRALDVAKASINLAAFAVGAGVTVILDRFIDHNGNLSTLVFTDPRLPPLCTAFQVDSSFDQFNSMVLSDWRLAHALEDLIAAIAVPHISSVNCARAIESLNHLLGPDTMNDKQKWENMRNLLNLSRDYLDFITEASKDNRLGKRTRIEGTVTNELVVRSWSVMNRYLEFRKRGGLNSLPLADFPTL